MGITIEHKEYGQQYFTKFIWGQISGHQSYCGDYFTMYANVKSLCSTPETKKILYINCFSIFKDRKERHRLATWI